jgi:amino acid transporter
MVIAVLAPVYIFYGFESAGDISEETKDAGRQVPRAMRHALIWGGLASFILTAALILAIPSTKNGFATAANTTGGVPYILGQLPSGLQDILLLLIIFAFFSCGTSVQGAGSRLAFSYARDGALPASKWISAVNPRFKTPVNALLGGAVVTVLFVLLEFASPTHDVKIWFITYPANTNVLVSLVSFGVSGIYLSFLVPAADADQRDPADRAEQPARLLQPRLDHAPGDARGRGGRRDLLPDRAPRPGAQRAHARRRGNSRRGDRPGGLARARRL